MAYLVNLYVTHPKNANDDCSTGTECETLEQAKAIRSNLREHFSMATIRSVEWVEIDGPDHNSCERNSAFAPSRDDDSAERSEFAMQNGMAFGVQGYNDAMGYDAEEYDPRIHGPDSQRW